MTTYTLFFAIRLAYRRQSSEKRLSGHHRVTEHHEKSANNTEVAQEKVEVEDETITKPLNDDNTEETSNCIFSVALEDDGTRATQHSLVGIK